MRLPAAIFLLSFILVLAVAANQVASFNLEVPYKVGILSDRYGDVLGELRLARSTVFEEHLSGSVMIPSPKNKAAEQASEGTESESQKNALEESEFARITVDQLPSREAECGNVRIFRASQKEAEDDSIKPYVAFRYCLTSVDGTLTSTGEYLGEGKSKGHFNLQVLSPHEFRLQLLDAFYANQTTVHAYSTPSEVVASSSSPWYLKFGIIVPVVLMFVVKTWLEVIRSRRERKQRATAASAAAAQKKK